MSNAQEDLVESITRNIATGEISTATLETDDRVLARITDGIYRQPASALRELIANSYDADAENVYVQTDPPTFSTISVRDDGNGLSIASLANLIHHIGGSPKRTQEGIGLGVVNRNDPALSPKGRRLIGKIGIGLFSVAQLTRQFQIISKVAGTKYRLVAEVILNTYTEDDIAKLKSEKKTKIRTGSVRIRSVPAQDVKTHGTEIILLNLRPQTKELLQSREIWMQVGSSDREEGESEEGESPSFHIASLVPGAEHSLSKGGSVPWTKSDRPETRFAKLYQGVLDEVAASSSNVKLEKVLDNYLRMLWTLSLSAPVDYIEKHPFDLKSTDAPRVYVLSNETKGQASPLRLKQGASIRESMGLKAPERGSGPPFHVFIDDIELKRPIRFNNLPKTSNVLDRPMMFVGRAQPDLSKISRDERGGDLAFEAYFMWTPKVVPREHNGVLIRISDASGTLFDETFLKYQTAEILRLRQITAEIYVSKGLDAALNIDRESFNYAHPHYQYVMRWVHRALRQLTNAQKSLSADERSERRSKEQRRQVTEMHELVKRKLKKIVRVDEIPDVVFGDDKSDLRKQRKDGVLAFDASVVFADAPKAKGATDRVRNQLEARAVALAQILEAYGVFRDMTYEKQQQLLQAIVAVFVDQEQ